MESDPRSISWDPRTCQIVAIAPQDLVTYFQQGLYFVAYINQVVDSVAKIVSE